MKITPKTQLDHDTLIEVSTVDDFRHYDTAPFVGCYQDFESIEEAKERLNVDYPERSQLKRYNRVIVRTRDNNLRTFPYGRTIEEEAIIEQPQQPSKSQLYGLLTQLHNLATRTNTGDIESAARSFADLLSKPDEILNEVEAIRTILKNS